MVFVLLLIPRQRTAPAPNLLADPANYFPYPRLADVWPRLGTLIAKLRPTGFSTEDYNALGNHGRPQCRTEVDGRGFEQYG